MECDDGTNKNNREVVKMKKLVVFYSRADENYFGGQYRFVKVGNTEKVAAMIADMTGAERFKIRQAVPYSENYRTCVEEAKRDWQAKARPELAELPKDLDAYDEIYLGYPNYCGTMPMAVYTFLESFDFSGKTIHPFCTHEGSGLSGTVNDIEKICNGAVVTKGLAIHGSSAEDAEPLVRDWLRTLENV
jgi:flavodoxin